MRKQVIWRHLIGAQETGINLEWTMRQIITFVVCLFGVACTYDIAQLEAPNSDRTIQDVDAQTKSSSLVYYWYNHEKIYLQPVEDSYFAIFKTTEEITQLASASSSDFKIKQSNVHSYDLQNQSNFLYARISGDILDAYEDNIVYYAPYLRTSSGEVGVTDRFYVKLKSPNDISILEHFAAVNGAQILSESTIPLWYSLVCDQSSYGNALELANKAYETGMFDVTDVEFIDDGRWEGESLYNDTYYSSHQWNLHGTYGLDIESVHSITCGDPLITVAIVDSGFELDHQDLVINHSWDAKSKTSPAKLYRDSRGNLISHGMMTAGIIGATANNHFAIAGVAPDISLLPISIGAEVMPETVSNAIRYAADNNADVISNSYTFDVPHSIVEAAFRYALNKGCIIVQCIGNASTTEPRYPYASIPEIITVGNITESGYRNTAASSYGSHLDVVAPGTLIMSLYPENKCSRQTGTSLACPHVAAVAGLVLSVNPDLSNREVSNIIEKTARKLPNYIFTENTNRSNGLWNEQVGYGLVNCYEAVTLARYYHWVSNYLDLLKFDYYGDEIEINLTIDDDIAIIWDWETKDISYINATATEPKDTTISHNYGATGSRRIIIAETVEPGETAPSSSTAMKRFDLTMGSGASNIEIYPVNSALEYVRLIGGSSIVSQTITIEDLPALKDLYLVRMPDVHVVVDNCPSLQNFGSSKYIWGAPTPSVVVPIVPGPGIGDILDPNVVGGGSTTPVWPDVPEPYPSFSALRITDCNALKYVSLENVDIRQFDFSDFPSLQYLYVSSHNDRIVGGTSSSLTINSSGEFLVNTIATLPARGALFKGKILVRGVNLSNTEYVEAAVAAKYQNQITTFAEENNWNVVWDSGVTSTW